MKKRVNITARYISLVGIFLAVTVFYVVMLAVVQAKGPSTERSDGSVAYKRQVTVSGLRGEIYDRNGVLLVGNSTSYDLIFEYGSIPDTSTEFNHSLLAALSAIERAGEEDKLCLDYYPFEGSYPELLYNDEAKREGSKTRNALLSILDANGLAQDAEPQELIKKLTSKYKLHTTLFKNEQIDSLLRVRYTMERIKFGIYQPLTLASEIDVELVSYIEEAKIDGANFKINAKREYAFPGYASHILGRLGKITAENAEYYSELGYPMDAYVGADGCEAEFEQYLRGKDGTLEISYDADGNIISKEFIEKPISGNDVYLTIDIELQIATEDSLKKNISKIESSNAGASVTLTPEGEILAIASYPTFDLSLFESNEYYSSLLSDPANPLYNRALLGEYAPGSVYKIGAALAALENKEINANSLINCAGTYPHLHRPTCLGVHGNINVVKAIEVSCNCFFYELGMKMGIDSITEYTKNLGLGAKTGIELYERVGSVAGSAYREQNGLTPWSKGDDLSAAIGQSDHTYTPLQLGVYMSSILNGGERYSAHLLHSVKKFYTKETVYEYTPSVLNDAVAVSDNTLAILKNGMRRVVSENSAVQKHFAALEVEVGGKTGTAQVSGKKDYAVFSGFAPFDSPEVISVCVLEEGVMGSNAAAVVGDIFSEYFNTKNDG